MIDPPKIGHASKLGSRHEKIRIQRWLAALSEPMRQMVCVRVCVYVCVLCCECVYVCVCMCVNKWFTIKW